VHWTGFKTGAGWLLSACMLMSAASVDGQVPVDTLPGATLAEQFLADPAGTTPEQVAAIARLHAVIRDSSDPRGVAARAVLVRALPGLEPGLPLIVTLRLLVEFEGSRPGWTAETLALVRPYLADADVRMKSLAIRSLRAASPELRNAAAPLIGDEIAAIGLPLPQRNLVGALATLGEPGDKEIDRLSEQGRLLPEVAPFVRQFRPARRDSMP
jgi:hypothetical protein